MHSHTRYLIVPYARRLPFLCVSAIYVNRGLQHAQTAAAAAGRGPQERNSYAKQAGVGTPPALWACLPESELCFTYSPFLFLPA